MRIVSIVGARPEFVQVAVLSRLLRGRHDEILIHTGQHYDDRMSERFFEELGIAKPDINLGIGSLPASAQTAEMLQGLAAAMRRTDPDLVIVRGDTNSTLAGAIAAKQLLLPLAHVEAGMRSYDRTMPEEINRIVTDHIADLQFVTDEAARERLTAEGVVANVYVCGDVMYDLFLQARHSGATLPPALLGYATAPYDLLTIHRAENADDRERLRTLVESFANAPRPVLFPVHPRTAARLDEFGIDLPAPVVALPPASYGEIVALESGARVIFTDSGGLQREAYFAEVPCVTLRDTTEWTNTVEAGWNTLVGHSQAAIRAALHGPPARPRDHPALFGDGDAAEKIVAALETASTADIVASARRIRAARGYAAASDV